MTKLNLIKIQNTIASGATTGTTLSKSIYGRILAIRTVYTNTTPGSSSDRDVNIFEMNPAARTTIAKAIQEILNIGGAIGATPEDDNNVYYPRVQVQNNAGTGVEYASSYPIYEPFVVYGPVLLSVTAAAVGDITTVYLLVEEF